MNDKMDNMLCDLFKESKKKFFECMKDDNNKKLFSLIDRMCDESPGILPKKNYKQVLYSILFFNSNLEEFSNILNKEDFSYIVSMTNFINTIDFCINDDGQLNFVEIKWVRRIKKINKTFENFDYTFTTRESEYKQLILKDFNKNFNYDMESYIMTIRGVDYEKLLNIISEIFKEENWKTKSLDVNPGEFYFFDEKKAFGKYFV